MNEVTNIKEAKVTGTMTKKDLFRIKAGLKAVGKLQGVKFAYTVAKNLQIVSCETGALVESIKASDKYLKYDRERIALCEQYAKKDDDGKAVIVGLDYNIKDRYKFDKVLKKLQKKYKAVIDERELQLKEYEALLDEPCEIVFHKINNDVLPENITGEQIFNIMEIIG